jgi:O-antigen/teichoic acid export membrane protein
VHVLAAYLLVSALLLVLFARRTWPAAGASHATAQLSSLMWRYALPLVPLGLIGWVNNLSDRYLIGATLGLEQAGIYAAMYGLASMPFMAAGGTLEQALRPVYQNAVAAGEEARAQMLLRQWLFAVTAVGACGVAVFAWGHEHIAGLLLGSRFRGESALMPWIAAGYAIRSLAYVYERMCYAVGQTRSVLVIQSSAAAVTLVATPIGALGWGLRGAAMAAPDYFGVQLLVAMMLARRSRLQATAVLGWVPG